MFRFAHPLAFVLLLLPLIWWWFHLRKQQGTVATLRYSDTRLLADLPVSWRIRLRFVPDALRVLAWLLLVIALARPQGGQAQEIIRGAGVDIVLAVDISGSMAAEDFAPLTRLEAAQSVIADFINGREFDRIGLVVFGRDAYHQTPLTLDYGVLRQSLDELQPVTEIGLPDGTALGLGLASAANMLRDSESPSKVIILLTDGNNNTALDPLTAADAVAALGIRVYTIGIGVPGFLPEVDLDEDTLQNIAESSDGLYFRAQDQAGLQAIYERIDALERSEAERQIFVRWQEWVDWWLLLGLVTLFSARVLRLTIFQSVP